jgi:hypothetical protein
MPKVSPGNHFIQKCLVVGSADCKNAQAAKITDLLCAVQGVLTMIHSKRLDGNSCSSVHAPENVGARS